MKTWEITVRVTHEVAVQVDAEDILKAGEMAMHMVAGRYDDINDMRCVDGEEVKHEV